MNKLLRFVLAAVFVGSAACFKTIIEVVPPQHVPTELQIMLNGANMSGKTINTVATSPLPLTARLVDGDGVEMGLPTPVQFSSSDTNVVVVDFAGLATARRSGSAQIFARLPLGTRELTNSVAVTYACSAAFVLGLSVTITDSLTGAVSSVASRWHVPTREISRRCGNVWSRSRNCWIDWRRSRARRRFRPSLPLREVSVTSRRSIWRKRHRCCEMWRH